MRKMETKAFAQSFTRHSVPDKYRLLGILSSHFVSKFHLTTFRQDELIGGFKDNLFNLICRGILFLPCFDWKGASIYGLK
jgi:hypothetical protein